MAKRKLPQSVPNELSGVIEIYTAGRQAWKVRAVAWFLLACGVGFAAWGWSLGRTFGLAPADGGVLRPLAERLALAGFMILFGIAISGGMHLYLGLYISRAWFDADTRRLRFETMRWWGHGQVEAAASEVVGGCYHSGELDTIRHQVNAPWYSVRLFGRKLPLILDGQGQLLQPGLAQRLLNL